MKQGNALVGGVFEFWQNCLKQCFRTVVEVGPRENCRFASRAGAGIIHSITSVTPHLDLLETRGDFRILPNLTGQDIIGDIIGPGGGF